MSLLLPHELRLLLAAIVVGNLAFCQLTVSAAGATKAAAKTTIVRAKLKQPSAQKPIRLKIEVPCRAWVPAGVQPSAVLLCVHGLGLSSKSYEQFGKQMQASGIGCFAVDVRGFGNWMKLQGKEKCDFDACLSDVVQALKVLHTAYPKKKVFVLGESMGGAIALRVAAEHPELVDGLISSVPSGDRFHNTKNKLRVAMNVMTLRGNKQIDVGTGVVNQATNNPAERANWKQDPLNRLKLTSFELVHFNRFMNDNHDAAEKIDRTPVLFFVGLKDKLVKPEGTRELYNEIKSEDKKLVTIRSSEHLIFENHQISPGLKAVITTWLQNHSN